MGGALTPAWNVQQGWREINEMLNNTLDDYMKNSIGKFDLLNLTIQNEHLSVALQEIESKMFSTIS